MTSSILGGKSLPVLVLMMSASFDTSNLPVGHIVLRTISVYFTGLFQLAGCTFLSRFPRFRSSEAFHVSLTRVRPDLVRVGGRNFLLVGAIITG